VLIFYVLVLCAILAACKTSESDDYIQGTWAFANESGDPRATELHVLHEWWFGRGRFFFQHEVTYGFPIRAEGRYRIVETSGEKIVLELYNIEGNATFYENQQIPLRMEIESDMLRINRVLYFRAGY